MNNVLQCFVLAVKKPVYKKTQKLLHKHFLNGGNKGLENLCYA